MDTNTNVQNAGTGELDPDIQRLCEFIQTSIKANRRIHVAEELAKVAPTIWNLDGNLIASSVVESRRMTMSAGGSQGGQYKEQEQGKSQQHHS